MSRAQLTSTVEQNTGGAVAPFVAGKNKIINGDFEIWQRGTSFSGGSYTADRWFVGSDGATTVTTTQQTFTPGTSPVSGYEGTYYAQLAITAVGGGNSYAVQRIEDVRTLAGQVVTLSFWAKANTSVTNSPLYVQSFGSGGSSAVGNGISTQTITTNWQRFTSTFTVPSMSGKTIGSSPYFEVQPIRVNTTSTIQVWGVQLEAGSVATPFTTATGTVQGELAACQRYYFRNTGGGVAVYNPYANGGTISTTGAYISFPFPQQMRVAPLAIEFSGIAVQTSGGTLAALSTLNLDQVSGFCASLAAVTASSWPANQPCRLINNNNGNGYVGFTSEL